MPYFYTSPTSNIPLQPQPSAVRMTRTGSSSSATSTSSDSSSISIPSPYNNSRPGSSSASFSTYWSSPSSASPFSYNQHGHGHSRHNSNGTSYLPTPFRSSLLHSSSGPSSSASPSANAVPSSYLSDDDLLSLSLESTHIGSVPSAKREMTTEEQVAAVREQMERERAGMRPEAWWRSQGVGQAEKRTRMVRFAGDGKAGTGAPSYSSRRNVAQGKRRGGSGKGSSRLD